MDREDAVGPPLPASVQLPDGSWVRGRSVGRPVPAGPTPDLGVYLGVQYRPPWRHVLLAWPDFGLPADPVHAAQVLQALHLEALAGRRVEVGCAGGRGRTGTALAALSILAGTEPAQAVDWVRRTYDRRAVETPWQRRWVVRRFPELVAAVEAGQDQSRTTPGEAEGPRAWGRGL